MQLLLLPAVGEHTHACSQEVGVTNSLTLCRFVEKLLFMLPMLSGPFRGMCLEVLASQADLRSQFYMELKDKGFHSMLTHRYIHVVHVQYG